MAIVEALCREKEQLQQYNAELDALHSQVTELVEQFLPLGTQGNSEVELQLLTDRQSVIAYLDTAAVLTRAEVLSMQAGPLLGTNVLQDGRERGRQLRGRGVRLRTIYPRMHVTGGHVDELVSAGYEIRVADTLPVRAITFDARRAVLAIDSVDPSTGVIAIEGEPLVRCFVAVFEYCWMQASDHRPPIADDGTLTLSPQERAVVRMLATGLKDEKIARQLAVSVRTVSRIVGDLMRRLDADSRFQAGVRAAGLGWTD